MTEVEIDGHKMILPWKQDGKLDMLEVMFENNSGTLKRLIKLHLNVFPEKEAKEFITSENTEGIVKDIGRELHTDRYDFSPIYWFLQNLKESTSLYVVPSSSLINAESKENRKFLKTIPGLFDAAVKFARWNSYSHSETGSEFGVDDMFPLVGIPLQNEIAELKREYTKKRRHEKAPLRFIPIFNLPFIYCQIRIPTSLETMHVTIDNLDKIYKEKKKITIIEEGTLGWIEYIRLMKIQMISNLKRVADLFVTSIQRLFEIRDLTFYEKQCQNMVKSNKRKDQKISELKGKNKILKEENKKLKESIKYLKKKENGTPKKRAGPKTPDNRYLKLGPKLE